MAKRNCNNTELLIRIDERVKTLFNAIPIIKQDIREVKKVQAEIKEAQFQTRVRIKELEKKVRNSVGVFVSDVLRGIFGRP